MKTITVFVIAYALVMSAECFKRENKCLPGKKHRAVPSREDSMLACQAYKENSCCTSDFTQQLATSPVRKIGNFSWTPCNNTLSRTCEAYMVRVECFYRCSHNAIFWKNPDYPNAILEAPVCASFCDGWFDACKKDLTCAKNWITGFSMTADGVNKCKEPCRNFSDYFSGGKDLCEGMWGATFVYKEIDCLQLNFTSPNPNDKLVEKLFGGGESKPASGAFVCSASHLVAVPVAISALLHQFLLKN